jgi:geranylgeranyl diphosphate synthase type I
VNPSVRLEGALRRIVDARRAGLSELGADLEPLISAGADFVLDGGKRLRPHFAYWGWRCVAPSGAPGEDAMLDAAASLELLHACALVHDDLMDASDSRRGHPSIHVRFAQLLRQSGWPGDAASFGAATAILLGDLLLSWADSTFAQALTRFPEEVRESTQAMFDAVHDEMLAGQYLDVLEQARGGFSPEAARRVVRYKTSKYTVERPLHIGACAAGAAPETVAALSGFGLAIGEAFQLRDDLLGVFGDPATTGKPAGDDLREGKRTVLVALGMQHADPAQAKALRAGVGNPDLDSDGVEALREVLVRTGAVDALEVIIDAQLVEGLRSLEHAASAGLVRRDAADALAALARAAVDRSA